MNYAMAAGLRLILDLSRLPDYEVPAVELLFAYMRDEVSKYQANLEAHPDGMRDFEKEKQRAERRKARVERLAARKDDTSSPKPAG